MNAIELLLNRASNGKLTAPGPDAETMRIVFEAAARAPDHALLRPWRVKIVQGDARIQLGELFAAHLHRHKPQATPRELETARSKALRAPLILVVAAVLKPHAYVPESEQLLSAGSAAFAMLMALQARGFGAIWRTGDVAHDPATRRALGFSDADAIVGFIYAGTSKHAPPRLDRPALHEFVSEWPGT